LLLRAAAFDPQIAALLDVNMTKLNGMARAMKSELAIPGVRAVSEESVAVRASRD
jgi:hypothetical protein